MREILRKECLSLFRVFIRLNCRYFVYITRKQGWLTDQDDTFYFNEKKIINHTYNEW